MSQTALKTAFNSLSDLKLWFNDKSGNSLMMSHVPEIIPLRWAYFRDNWEFIIDTLRDRVRRYQFPDMLDSTIAEFDSFIKVQRNNQNKKVNPFSSSRIYTDFYAIWDNIEVSSIPLTRQEVALIESKLNKVRRFIRTDFVNIRSNLIVARDGMADTVGLSDEDYNKSYGRSPTRQLRTAKITDITNMQTLQDGIVSVEFILANSNSLSTTTIDPFALARINANNPDIDIRLNKSGRLVRMFFGDSLQSLAYRYLGSSDRWIDIAIANGLKSPYIDEVGEAISLISNGSKNQINIARVDGNGNLNKDKIYINQIVFLQSSTVKFPDQRVIQNIKEIPVSGELVIELSGERNLDTYTLSDSAYVRVFKPNTINSNFLVMIPSESETDTLPGRTPYFLNSKSEDEKRAGIDLAVNDNMDLVFTSTGDLSLSFGLANAIQAVQFKMLSEKGQSALHPNFGLPSVVGMKIRDPEGLKQTIVSGITQMIENDSRFSRIEQLDVKLVQAAMMINMVVRMAGSGTLVPLSYSVNVG